MRDQTTANILMVRPAHFGFNEETANSNAFQVRSDDYTGDEASRMAVKEFDAFVAALQSEGVNVIVVEDSLTPIKPDAVFPNNWITFHQDGTVITYPMLSKTRRLERRDDIIENLKRDFSIERRIAFEALENDGLMLEGTGSLILDRVNKVAYACFSPRTTEELLSTFCKSMDYQAVGFHSVDQEGKDIYHTNVMMAMGETFAVICLDSVKDPQEKASIKEKLAATNKEIIAISYEQMMQFAGNMLQVRNRSGQTILVMSEAAYQSLSPEQIIQIEKHTKILHQAIPTIEALGGGSVRCMMAEVFLPPKK